MQRQSILERIGWRFIRIRGSQYFRNPEVEMKRVIEQLNIMEIYPEDDKIIINKNRTSDLLEKVKRKASEYFNEDFVEDKPGIVNNTDIAIPKILYALDSNKTIDKLKDPKILDKYVETKEKEEETIFDFLI